MVILTRIGRLLVMLLLIRIQKIVIFLYFLPEIFLMQSDTRYLEVFVMIKQIFTGVPVNTEINQLGLWEVNGKFRMSLFLKYR